MVRKHWFSQRTKKNRGPKGGEDVTDPDSGDLRDHHHSIPRHRFAPGPPGLCVGAGVPHRGPSRAFHPSAHVTGLSSLPRRDLENVLSNIREHSRTSADVLELPAMESSLFGFLRPSPHLKAQPSTSASTVNTAPSTLVIGPFCSPTYMGTCNHRPTMMKGQPGSSLGNRDHHLGVHADFHQPMN